MSVVLEKTECRHCGTVFTPSKDHREFCCTGCQFVYRMIQGGGLDHFYDLKGAKELVPVKSLVFEKRDYGWLKDAVAEAEAKVRESGQAATLEVDVQGLSCVACVWLIERVFRKQPGALRCLTDVQAGRMALTWSPGEFDATAFAGELQQFGYALGPASADRRERGGHRGLTTRLGLCGAFALNAMAFTLPRYLGMGPDFFLASLFDLVVVASATLALLVGGGYFIQRAWRSLRLGAIHMDTPISLGLLAAYGGSLVGWALKVENLMFFDFVGIFVFLMLLGRWLQEGALEQNRHRVLEYRGNLKAVTLLEGAEAIPREAPAEELNTGQTYRLDPGDTAPVASALEGGPGEFSLEWINGEPEARLLEAGGRVPAGAVNVGRAPVTLQARERFENSLLSRLMKGGELTATRRAPVERGLQVYLFLVLLAALAGGLWWWLVRVDGGAVQGLQVAIAVLVVSCPCALGVALPLVDEISQGRMRSRGLFVRSSDLWRRLKAIRRVVFDKTGTLTMEAPRLTNPEALKKLDGEARGRLALLVRDSLHPVGRALREALAAGEGWTEPSGDLVAPLEDTPGQGVVFRDGEGRCWSLGRPGWKDMAMDAPTTGFTQADAVFAVDGKPLATFRFEESLREDAEVEIQALHRSGLKLAILSGDQESRVGALAKRLQIHDWHAGLSPEEKADWIRAHEPERTLYIGDGGNDSLAFDEAGCRGTPAVGAGLLEGKADFYYLGRGLHAVSRIFQVAKERRSISAAVVSFAVTYNVVAVTLSLGGHMSPLLAAILMPLSSLATLFIASRHLERRRRMAK